MKLHLPRRPRNLTLPGEFLLRISGFSTNIRAAILFAYWLFLASLGILSGVNFFVSLFLACLALMLLIGLVALQRWGEMTLPNTAPGRLALYSLTALSLIAGWFFLFVPILLLIALLLWGVFAVPLWSIR